MKSVHECDFVIKIFDSILNHGSYIEISIGLYINLCRLPIPLTAPVSPKRDLN